MTTMQPDHDECVRTLPPEVRHKFAAAERRLHRQELRRAIANWLIVAAVTIVCLVAVKYALGL